MIANALHDPLAQPLAPEIVPNNHVKDDGICHGICKDAGEPDEFTVL